MNLCTRMEKERADHWEVTCFQTKSAVDLDSFTLYLGPYISAEKSGDFTKFCQPFHEKEQVLLIGKVIFCDKTLGHLDPVFWGQFFEEKSRLCVPSNWLRECASL